MVRWKLLAVQNYGVLALIQGNHVQSESNFHSSKVHISLGLFINSIKFIFLLEFSLFNCFLLVYHFMYVVRTGHFYSITLNNKFLLTLCF
jgi:hypothetical protein